MSANDAFKLTAAAQSRAVSAAAAAGYGER